MNKKYLNPFLCFLLCSHFVSAQINYQEVAANVGMDIACGNTYLGNGVSLVDFNGDGWDDISLATKTGQPRFFVNNNGSFVEQTINLTSVNFQTKSVTWVDIDNDGDKDLFVTSDTNGNRLFENTGNLILVDITVSAGISTANMFSYGVSWGDIDNDGLLDLFINNRSEILPNKLYKNLGNNTFLDVSSTAGISSDGHMSFCSAFFDYNNDGWQDLYISTDKYNNANIFYENNGDGTFSDISEFSNTNVSIDAMTTTIGDYNNDGWFDIYVSNSTQGNVFFKNIAGEYFSDIATLSGTSFNSVGWGSVFLDADNDKDIDLYVSGSLDGTTASLLSSAFYENIGNDSFNLVNNTSGFSTDNKESYSNAVGDIDNDGLIDIVVTNGSDQDITIWKNQSTTSNNWLKVNLSGIQSNKDGIGSVLEISINAEKQYRYVHAGEGYMSQNSLVESFGLGSATTVDYIKVTWLSGIVDVINNVNANQQIAIIEGMTLSTNTYSINPVTLQSNPVTNYVVVNSTSPINKLELYSILGQRISLQENVDKLNVSQLKSGQYFLHVTNSQGVSVLKFLKK